MRPTFLALLAFPATLAALTPAPAAAQDGEATAPLPDIAITATVHARSVTFHSKPDVQVELTGTPGRRDVDETLRDNLPEEVQPGRTYHDVDVRFEASTTLDPAAVSPFGVGIDVDSLPSQDEATP